MGIAIAQTLQHRGVAEVMSAMSDPINTMSTQQQGRTTIGFPPKGPLFPSPTETLNRASTAPGNAPASPPAQSEGESDGIRVILKRVGTEGEDQATIISRETSYKLDITLDGELFIGAVQLSMAGVPKEEADPPIDLIPRKLSC